MDVTNNLSDLRPPSTGELRIKILASSVFLPDVETQYGRIPFVPKIPFVPSYAVIGDVDAVGKGVTSSAGGGPGVSFAVYGGNAEYIFVDEKKLIPVPTTLDPGKLSRLS